MNQRKTTMTTIAPPIDWTLPNKVIAASLGVGKSRVSFLRRIHAANTLRAYRKRNRQEKLITLTAKVPVALMSAVKAEASMRKSSLSATVESILQETLSK
jgi:hypothetical protein